MIHVNPLQILRYVGHYTLQVTNARTNHVNASEIRTELSRLKLHSPNTLLTLFCVVVDTNKNVTKAIMIYLRTL